MLKVAEAMALVGYRFFTDKQFREKVKEDFSAIQQSFQEPLSGK